MNQPAEAISGTRPRRSTAGQLRSMVADIKLAHSVFAMPFALLAAFIAASEHNSIVWNRFAGQLGLIVLAMVCARTVAMLANRIIDRDIDARNPRTRGRALPSGTISLHAATAAVFLSSLLFMLVCIAFGLAYDNWWPTVLGVPVLLWIASYAWFKRWTWLCHLYLGSSLALSPIAAAIAIEPAALSSAAIWLLAGVVMFWVAGFDVIYALQDIDTDRTEGLHSMPARFGQGGALAISRFMHALAAVLLIAIVLIDERFHHVFAVAVAIVISLLIAEHSTVARWGRTKIALAFFTINGVISILLGILGIIDVLY